MSVHKQKTDLDTRLLKAVDALMLELVNHNIHDASKAGDMADKHLENYNVCVEGDGHGDVDDDYIQVSMNELLKAIAIGQEVHEHKLE